MSDKQSELIDQSVSSLTFIEEILKFSVGKKASDVHLKVNSVPIFRIDGELVTQRDFSYKSSNS